jgi:DNA-directed RNA polymerase subunit RPC12/RpoP
MEERKLQCPNCSRPMNLYRIERNIAQQTPRLHYECKPCGVGITEAIDEDPDNRTLQ